MKKGTGVWCDAAQQTNRAKGTVGDGATGKKTKTNVRMLWVEPKVKESFDKDKKVVTFFKSSTIGRNDLGKVQKDLYDRTLTSLKQECPTRWLSVHGMGESLMKVQENVQMYCVKEEMRDGDGQNFKMGFF